MKYLDIIRVDYLLILLVITLLIGCKKDENLTTFEFQGNWSGTYTGTEDEGTWKITIDESGVVSGSANSNIYDSNYQITGNVNFDGQFYATFGNISFGGSFTGKISGNKMNGTWVNDNNGHTGSWSGSKEGGSVK